MYVLHVVHKRVWIWKATYVFCEVFLLKLSCCVQFLNCNFHDILWYMYRPLYPVLISLVLIFKCVSVVLTGGTAPAATAEWSGAVSETAASDSPDAGPADGSPAVSPLLLQTTTTGCTASSCGLQTTRASDYYCEYCSSLYCRHYTVSKLHSCSAQTGQHKPCKGKYSPVWTLQWICWISLGNRHVWTV